ncbi:MAG: hypothetical protein Q9220_001984 [cf. Caloplaca sp. 1 TL-2023]
MDLKYHFTSPDEAQLRQRRHLLDTYGQLAQLSALIPLLAFQIPTCIKWLRSRYQVLDKKGKEHASPVASRFKEQILSDKKTPVSLWARFKWILDQEIAQGWGVWKVLLSAVLWTSWLLFLAIKDTGDDYLHLTKRFGIIGASQLPLHYLLAVKTSWSPISYLTKLSHEELNPYHRALGRILILFFSLHASFYLNFYIQKSLLSTRIRDRDVILGLSAITSFLILGTTALAKIRTRNYFLFFVIHVTLSLSVLPILYFHVSHLRIYILESAVVYALLIIQRNVSQTEIPNAAISKDASSSNILSITLPLTKSLSNRTFHPGQHIYLSLPPPLTAPHEKLRLNPFTVANIPNKDGHIQLALRTLNGATRILADKVPPSSSTTSGTTTTPLLIEGPYGAAANFPNLFDFDSLLFVAGGVGATFTLPIYRDLRHRGVDASRMKFVWAVRDVKDIGWARELLKQETEELGIEVYETGTSSKQQQQGGDEAIELQDHREPLLQEARDGDDDDDGTTSSLSHLPPNIKISHHRRRPNFSSLVQETFASVPASGKVAVLVCGPPGMGAALRKEVGVWVSRGREVWWHGEEFGW